MQIPNINFKYNLSEMQTLKERIYLYALLSNPIVTLLNAVLQVYMKQCSNVLNYANIANLQKQKYTTHMLTINSVCYQYACIAHTHHGQSGAFNPARNWG